MKKFLMLLISALTICLIITFSACERKENMQNEQKQEAVKDDVIKAGVYIKKDGIYSDDKAAQANKKTSELIEKAKFIAERAGYSDINFDSVVVEKRVDNVKNINFDVVLFKRGEKNMNVFFREENGNFMKFESGDITSEGAAMLGADDVDEVLNIAKNYYITLPVEQGYELKSWQMDFSGIDWQIDFVKKIENIPTDEEVYNYSECVRMRISGIDGKILGINVFDTPVNMDNTDGEIVSYDEALVKTGLDKKALVSGKVACYTIRDKGYARLCYCFEFDYSAGDACDTRTVYIDLYTGEVIGKESCA